jgi:hypothetical protein
MDAVKRFVGIDVAKAALDVFIGSAGAAFSVANDEVGIRELLRQLAPADFVILEATGGDARRQRSGNRRDRGCDSQSQAGAGLCPCYRQAGQDRPAGCRCWRVSAKRCDQRHGR